MRLKLSIVAAAAILFASPAFADNYQQNTASGAATTFCSKVVGIIHTPCQLIYGMFGSSPRALSVDTNGYLNVNATVNTSGAAFTPTGAAVRSVSTTSARVPLPTADASTLIENTGTTDAFFAMGDATVVATTSSYRLTAGHSIMVATGTNTYLAGITASGTSSLAITTGTGTVVIAGGGGGGGGGGGAATIADGADTTQGALADAACSTDNGTCSSEALMKRLNQRITSLLTALGSPFQASGSLSAGANIIGKVGIDPANNTVSGTVAATQSGGWSFGLTGTLPAFAATPTFKVDQSTPGTTNGVQINAALPAGVNNIGNVGISGTITAKQQDSGGGDVTDTTRHAVKNVSSDTIVNPSDGFSTPTSTSSSYADQYLIGSSATPASVHILTFSGSCVVAGGNVAIRAANIDTADTTFLNKTVLLEIYNVSPTLDSTSGDKLPWLTNRSGWLGEIQVTLNRSFKDAGTSYVKGRGPTNQGSEIDGACASGSTTLYGLPIMSGSSSATTGNKAWNASLEGVAK